MILYRIKKENEYSQGTTIPSFNEEGRLFTLNSLKEHFKKIHGFNKQPLWDFYNDLECKIEVNQLNKLNSITIQEFKNIPI